MDLTPLSSANVSQASALRQDQLRPFLYGKRARKEDRDPTCTDPLEEHPRAPEEAPTPAGRSSSWLCWHEKALSGASLTQDRSDTEGHRGVRLDAGQTCWAQVRGTPADGERAAAHTPAGPTSVRHTLRFPPSSPRKLSGGENAPPSGSRRDGASAW